MRRAAKLDANQTQVVSALEAAGVSVLGLAALGKGKPDILACKGGKAILMEIKNPKTARGRMGANPAQEKFIQAWRGCPAVVVDGPEAALKAIGAIQA